MKPIFLLCSTLALISTTRAGEAIYIAATETKALEAKEGQKVTVYGMTKDSEKSSSGTNFVNFDGSDFYLVTFKTDLKDFPEGEPSDIFDGKRLAVTGTISIYQGKPQIKLTSPEQVQILTENEVFPPVAEKSGAEPNEPSNSPSSKKTDEPAAEPKPDKPKPPVDPSQYFKD